MNIALIQPDIIWESPEENLEKYDLMLDKLNHDNDLIVLPEMFTTGFSMHSEKLARPAENKYVDWMLRKVEEHRSAITGSLIINEKGKYYNRLIFADSEGKLSVYDKRHLFKMGGEGEHFSAGRKKLIVKQANWKICPLVCYDLRFPVWSRNRDEYDMLLYVANWPASRAEVWNTLLRARAIENQCWVVAVNRVGIDGENIQYNGESQVIDPKGNIRMKLNSSERVAETSVSLEDLRKFKKKFPVWNDRDDFIAEW